MQAKTAPVERVRFAWAEKTAPKKQLQVRLTTTAANADHPLPVKKRVQRFLIRLRSD
jgi:hypothetical protein